jgi:hypothetical protein
VIVRGNKIVQKLRNLSVDRVFHLNENCSKMPKYFFDNRKYKLFLSAFLISVDKAAAREVHLERLESAIYVSA